jgi:DNA integrity scanning protein DisA with diadenylate cyclase activity
VSDLPKRVPIKIEKAPAMPSDGVTDLNHAVLMLIILIMIVTGPAISYDPAQVFNFGEVWAEHLKIMLLVTVIFTFYTAAVKLQQKEWNKKVRNAVVITNIIYLIGFVYIFARPDMFVVAEKYLPIADKLQKIIILVFVLGFSDAIRRALVQSKLYEKPQTPENS